MEVDSSYKDFLAKRREAILSAIDRACERAGRSADDVQVFAVSKTVGVAEVMAAMEVGYDAFAENRPQALVAKLQGFEEAGVEPPRFDMIGNLQKNKINAILGKVDRIQSVASTHLAQAISKRAEERDLVVPVLLEVNVSGEPSKSGFDPKVLEEEAEVLQGLPGIEIGGLMTMAPAHEPVEDRETFSGLRELARDLEAEYGFSLPCLSCGMSDDFTIAIEEGATVVRLGRIVFDRDYPIA